MKIITINSMWCPACIIMHKVWKQTSEKYSDIEFINYDYDMDEEIVKTFEPGSLLPVTIFIKDDKEIARLNGEKKIEEIEKIILQYK